MKKVKVALWSGLVLLLVLAAGWLWGATGRWASQAQVRDVTLRLRMAEARGALAGARIDVFELNFGQASREIERARAALGDAAGLLDAADAADAAVLVRQALAKAVEAQRLAGAVDQAANSRLAAAIETLDRAAGIPRH